MKLAEALLLRRDLNNRLFQLRNEISSSVLVQEGDTWIVVSQNCSRNTMRSINSIQN